MTLEFHPLSEHVGAEADEIDLTQPVSDDVVRDIKAALDVHSVLVFRNQRFSDDSQTAFSARFGELERTVYKREGDGGVPVANITNVDFRTNEIFPEGHSRLRGNSGNEMWHTDSSFKPVPAYCSMLSGREVPPLGGNTEFASCRAGYAALSVAQRAELDGLIAEHDYGYSRSLVAGYETPPETLTEVPPVHHAVVRTNPVTGARNFYTGAHASRILGWPLDEGRQRLKELVGVATQTEFVYVHHWRPFDFVIWDNRCVLHRATQFDSARYRRVMRRTTVAGSGPTVDAEGRVIVGA